MASHASIAKQQLRQYVAQIRSRDVPTTTAWVPSNEDEVDSAQLFIAEQLPTGYYELL